MFDDTSRAAAPDPVPHDPHPDSARAALDPAALPADPGLPSRAIREVLGHPVGAGPDG